MEHNAVVNHEVNSNESLSHRQPEVPGPTSFDEKDVILRIDHHTTAYADYEYMNASAPFPFFMACFLKHTTVQFCYYPLSAHWHGLDDLTFRIWL